MGRERKGERGRSLIFIQVDIEMMVSEMTKSLIAFDKNILYP